MKDQTLATIDSNLVETGQFLEEIVSDPQKDKCLQTFVNSQEIIGWLKGFTTSKLMSTADTMKAPRVLMPRWRH